MLHWTAQAELVKMIFQEKNVRPVVVRFTTFRHRTMFYRARKKVSKNGVHKERFTLYQKARDLVKSKKFVKHVYVDVNCRLKVTFENNKELLCCQLAVVSGRVYVKLKA